MPGFAAAKPGTGQTVRAIIAPASCRHDNCNAHCLIIVRLSDPALYIAPLRPLPAGNPAGPALHNKTLCKLARGDDETHAANAATALKMAHGPRPVEVAALRQLRRLHTCHLTESPSGFRRSLQCPAAPARSLPSVIYCHSSNFLRLIVLVAASSGHWGRAPNGFKGTV